MPEYLPQLPTNFWTIDKLINWSTEYLKQKGVDSPRLDAEVLLSHLLGIERLELYLDPDRSLNQTGFSDFKSLIRRRGQREPLQYLTGKQEFWSLNFKITEDVLIPRPETELLVEEAVKIISEESSSVPKPRILDLGTGCGIISIALAKEIGSARILATDISRTALEVARENAARHRLEDKILFLCGNLFGPLKDDRLCFNLIISNPPYIPSGGFGQLEPEVRDFEPHQALNGGEEGLEFLHRIADQADRFLLPEGWLLLEVGEGQAEKVAGLLKESPRYQTPMIVKDYSGRPRVVKARKKSAGGS
ncbi:MAG: peptide chain release factor N(5)-glutamine methyltransferase [Deltaproteobacteria bacterium]|nr:MAG: peptide chain release factor N(5)-glutamine methyltransferase [Deltaproteobacteria bacterium]